MIYDDNYYMNIAINEANKAFELGEVPVGAVIVKDNEIIALSHNYKETYNNCLKHAELIAIDIACGKLNSWRLNDCILYVTLEPCLMCLGAIIESRIDRVVIGSYKNNKQMFEYNKIKFTYGIMKKETDLLLKNFFKNLRN